MKTAFRFRLRLRRLRSAYDLVKTRLWGSEAEAEELNQSQSVGMCIVIGLSCRYSNSDPAMLTTPPTIPIFYFH